MKKLLALVLTMIMAFILAACSNNNRETSNSNESSSTQTKETSSFDRKKQNNNQTQLNTGTKKILVVYFSREGNTAKIDNIDAVSGASFPSGDTSKIATQIHENVGGDILEIKTVDPYSTDYKAVVDQAKKEQQNNYRPKLATKVENMDSYDVIFVGYPNWWGTMPMAVFTFLEQYNFSGKTIVPFCTHEGSALGRSVTDITKLCPQSTILDGLAIRGGNIKNAKEDVSKWLHKIGMIKE